MAWLSDWIDALSRRLTAFIALIVGVLLLFWFMTVIAGWIEAQSGYGIFDAPWLDYSADDLATALAAYDARTVGFLWLFYALDFVFPALGALITATMAAWGLRNIWPTHYPNRIKPWLPIFLLGAVPDWLENIAFLALLTAYPPVNDSLVEAYFSLRTFKGQASPLSMMAVLFVAVGGVAFTWRAFRSRLAPEN